YTFHVSRVQASQTRELTQHGLSWRKPRNQRKTRNCILDPHQSPFFVLPTVEFFAATSCKSERNRGCRGYARINTNRVNWLIRAYPRNPRFPFFVSKPGRPWMFLR